MGTCTGVSSTCALAGIALETRCHLGQVVRYDTVSKLGWSANVIHHGIQALIDGVLSKEDINWGSDDEMRSVPPLTVEDDCVVSDALRRFGFCGDWRAHVKYFRIASTGSSATIAMRLRPVDAADVLHNHVQVLKSFRHRLSIVLGVRVCLRTECLLIYFCHDLCIYSTSTLLASLSSLLGPVCLGPTLVRSLSHILRVRTSIESGRLWAA